MISGSTVASTSVAEPLDHRHAAATARLDAVVAGAGAKHPEHCVQQHTDDRPAHVMVPSQLIP
jgi:hypothetical protein